MAHKIYVDNVTVIDAATMNDVDAVVYTNSKLVTDIHTAPPKATPVDADELGIWNSVGSVLGKVTFSNLWLWIAAYTGNVTNKTFTTGNAFNGTLGATTPAAVTATTVTASGAVAGSNLSGINTGDQTALQVSNTPAGNIAATTVQAALNELDVEKANLTRADFTGPVSLINATQPTPAAGYTTIYPKADKLLYYKDDAGVERLLADNKGPAFSAYKSASQTIADSIITKVIFDGKEFDTANAFDNVTNNRFKPLVAGYYSISAQVYPNTNTTYCQTMLYKNNLQAKRSISSGANTGPPLSALIYLDGVNDYIELFGSMTGTTPTITNDASLTFFQAFLARRA
jgi:hypothetical protein